MGSNVMQVYLEKMDEFFSKFETMQKDINIATKQLQDFSNKAKNLNFDKANKSVNVLKSSLKQISKIMDAIYNKTKLIVFASIGLAFSGFGIGNAGKQSNINASNASSLGLRQKSLIAMQQTATITGNNQDYYSNMYDKLDSARHDINKNKSFALMGIDIAKLQNKKDFELIEYVVKAIQSNKNFKTLSQHNRDMLDNAISETLGLNYKQTMGINIKGASNLYKERFSNLRNIDYNKLNSVGMNYEKMLLNFSNLFNKVASDLSNGINTLFNSLSKGFKDLTNSQSFQNLLDRFSSFIKDVSSNASSYIMKFFVLTPLYIEKFIAVFDKIKLAFMEFDNIVSKLSTIKTPMGNITLFEYQKKYSDKEREDANKAYDNKILRIAKDLALARSEIDLKSKKGITDIKSFKEDIYKIKEYDIINKTNQLEKFKQKTTNKDAINIINNVMIDENFKTQILNSIQTSKSSNQINDAVKTGGLRGLLPF